MKKIIIIGLIFISFSCVNKSVENYYNLYYGTAKITSIKISQYNPSNDNSYYDIFFDFTLNNKENKKYKYLKFSDKNNRLFINHRGNLHKKWIISTGIKEGDVYPAIRFEKKGAFGGAPVFFKVEVKHSH